MKTALFMVPGDDPGGAEQIASTLANAVSRRPGWRVEYSVLSPRSDPSFSLSRLAPEVEARFGNGSPTVGWLALPAQLTGRSFDLVFTTHVHTNALMCVARRLGWLRTRRLVTRESTTLFDRFSGPRAWLVRTLYAAYGSQDLAISQTAYMLDHIAPRLTRRAADRLVVLGNPVDLPALDRLAAFPPPEAVTRRLSGRVNLLVCGRMIEMKQPLLALETFASLVSERSERLQLVFMGDGPLRLRIEQHAQALGLADCVVFLGRQANPYPIMRLCQYGLLTSSREGFPNVVLEMMACGLRKIVTTPCAGDLNTLPGVTVTKGFDAPQLADALVRSMTAGEDLGDSYRAAVSDRSVARYVDAVLA